MVTAQAALVRVRGLPEMTEYTGQGLRLEAVAETPLAWVVSIQPPVFVGPPIWLVDKQTGARD